MIDKKEIVGGMEMLGKFVSAKIKRDGLIVQGWVININPLKIVCRSGKLYKCGEQVRIEDDPPRKTQEYIEYLEKKIFAINSALYFAEEWSKNQDYEIPESNICIAAVKDIHTLLNV